MHSLTSKIFITHITWPICRDLWHDRIPVAPQNRTPRQTLTRLQLSPDFDSVTLADSRYRSHNTPKNNAAFLISTMWRSGILLGLTTPLLRKKKKKKLKQRQKKKVACNMLQWKAVGKSLAMFESKRVSGLSIMCNATAHKISVPWPARRAIEQGKAGEGKGGEGITKLYADSQYPSRISFSSLIRCRQTTVQPTNRPTD